MGRTVQHYSDQPHVGYFKMRRVRRGPFVAVSIGLRCPMVLPDADIDAGEWCRPYDRSRPMVAWVDGAGWADAWKIYGFCHRIDETEYRFLTADRAWARKHTPEAPEANPDKPVDLSLIKPIF